jgi:hypothetical protein
MGKLLKALLIAGRKAPRSLRTHSGRACVRLASDKRAHACQTVDLRRLFRAGDRRAPGDMLETPTSGSAWSRSSGSTSCCRATTPWSSPWRRAPAAGAAEKGHVLGSGAAVVLRIC